MNENVSLVISRQVLTDVSSRLLFLPDEISKAVSHYTLDKVNCYSIDNKICENYKHDLNI